MSSEKKVRFRGPVVPGMLATLSLALIIVVLFIVDPLAYKLLAALALAIPFGIFAALAVAKSHWANK